LLAFDCIAAALFLIAPEWGNTLGRFVSRASRSPVSFFATLVAVSGIAYIPLALKFNPVSWAVFGPFTFQSSRVLHYLVYFLIAVGIGAWGVDRGLLTSDGKLARRWPLWVGASLVFYAAVAVVAVVAATTHAQSQLWSATTDAFFVLSCAASCFALLAVFLRFARTRSRIFDNLSANSYGIYLVHYVFVSWLQYALLPASVPAPAKAAVVFTGALAFSWFVSASIRKIPAVARIV
jgi:surface polysaccharide O-acyltransferase-like enzyme